ncbi:hypothetical protein FKM82_011294 [Ascaphus truei]
MCHNTLGLFLLHKPTRLSRGSACPLTVGDDTLSQHPCSSYSIKPRLGSHAPFDNLHLLQASQSFPLWACVCHVV